MRGRDVARGMKRRCGRRGRGGGGGEGKKHRAYTRAELRQTFLADSRRSFLPPALDIALRKKLPSRYENVSSSPVTLLPFICRRTGIYMSAASFESAKRVTRIRIFRTIKLLFKDFFFHVSRHSLVAYKIRIKYVELASKRFCLRKIVMIHPAKLHARFLVGRFLSARNLRYRHTSMYYYSSD